MPRWFEALILVLAAILSPACTPAAKVAGQNDHVLFLLGEQFDPQEFWGPYAALCAAGYQVDLAGAEKGVVLTPDSDLPEANVRTNISLGEVDVSRYFALVVPGGPSAANIARFPKAGQIASKFNAEGRLIGTVCHGARLLMPEGIFKNRPTTCVFMVADELCDQWKSRDYGMYLDLPVVIGKNLVCSRDPRDVPAMAQALVDRFAASGGLQVAPRKGQALIVLPGATKHQKWVFDMLGIFGMSAIFWKQDRAQDISADSAATSADMLVILDGTGLEEMSASKSFASAVDFFRRSNKPILVKDTARQSLAGIDWSTAKVIRAGNIAGAMRQIVLAASPAAAAKKVTYPDSKQWEAEYHQAAAVPIQGAPWNPALRYDAVLALWHGYDDYAAARMNEFLRQSGRKVLVVGPKTGALSGLNGAEAAVAATYQDRIRLSSSPIIVAPGGVWPKKTKAQQAVQPRWVEDDEPARQKRLDWLTAAYRSGWTLVAFGFDSLYIGQQKMFKGKHFASTDQASVIWFGSEGAEYSPEMALFSDRNLLTAKPLVGVDEAIRLLREHLKRKEAGRVLRETI